MKIACVTLLLSVISYYSFSQNDIDTCYYPQTQVSEVVYKIVHPHKKHIVKKDSLIAHKIYAAVLPGVGYTLQSGFTGVCSANLSFYMANPNTTNLSTFNTDVEYSPFKKQLFIPLITSIWTYENKWNITTDVRYYQFPSLTYGTGAYSDTRIVDNINYNYFKAHLALFKTVKKDFYVGIGYQLDKHYRITSNDSNTNFKQYHNGVTHTTSSGLWLCAKYDSRRNINNPQGGAYLSVSVRNNAILLGSNNNWQSLLIDARKYVKLPTKRSNIFAFWVYSWSAMGKHIPYLDLPSTGWDTYTNVGRGYIQSRLRDKYFAHIEAEYRFDILKNGLLGGVVFANAQSVNNVMRIQRILPSIGTGLRLKLNKHSKVNFAVDYAVGINGSQGFFFDVAEVF